MGKEAENSTDPKGRDRQVKGERGAVGVRGGAQGAKRIRGSGQVLIKVRKEMVLLTEDCKRRTPKKRGCPEKSVGSRGEEAQKKLTSEAS